MESAEVNEIQILCH